MMVPVLEHLRVITCLAPPPLPAETSVVHTPHQAQVLKRRLVPSFLEAQILQPEFLSPISGCITGEEGPRKGRASLASVDFPTTPS